MASLGELTLTLKTSTSAFDSAVKKSAALVVGLSTALAGVSVKAAGDFEQAIVNAGAKASASATQIDKLTAAATKAGLESAFSAKQAADALGLLAQAGLLVNEQTDALPGVLDLASAGMLGLTEATDIAVGAVKGFGLEVSDLGRVNDVLVKAANSANTSVQDLGAALSYAAPTAAGLGVSLEEVSAAVGILGNAGIKATRAGTSLNNIIASLGKASKKLGAGFTNADIETLGLAGALEKLEASGLSAANAVDIFGKNAGPAVAAMLNQGIDSIRELDETLQNAGGTAAEVAAKQLDTFNGQLTLLSGSAETLAAKLGSALTPVLRAIATDLIEQTNALLSNDGAMRAFGKGVQSAVLDAASALDAFAPAITVVTTTMGALVDGVRVLNVAASTLAIGIGGLVEGYLEMRVATNKTSENVQALADHQAKLATLVNDTRETIDNFGSSTMAGVEAGSKLTAATEGLAAKMKEGAANIDLTTKAVEDLAEKATTVVGPMDDLELVLNGFPAPDKPKDYAGALDKVKTKAEATISVVKELFDLMKSRGATADAIAGHGEAFLAERGPRKFGPATAPAAPQPWEAPDNGVGAAQARASLNQGGTAAIDSAAMEVATALTGGLIPAFTDLWKSSESFSQALGMVSDMLNVALGPVVEGIGQNLVTILKPIMGLLEGIAPLLSVLFTVLNPIILPLKVVAGLFKALAKPINSFIRGIKKAFVALINIGRKSKNKAYVTDDGQIIDPKGKFGDKMVVIEDDSVISNQEADRRKAAADEEAAEAAAKAAAAAGEFTREISAAGRAVADMGARFSGVFDSPMFNLGMGEGAVEVWDHFHRAADATDSLAESAREAARSLSNVPTIFRANLRSSQAGMGSGVSTGGGSGGDVYISGNVIVQGANLDETLKNIRRKQFTAYGETYTGLAAVSAFPSSG